MYPKNSTISKTNNAQDIFMHEIKQRVESLIQKQNDAINLMNEMKQELADLKSMKESQNNANTKIKKEQTDEPSESDESESDASGENSDFDYEYEDDYGEGVDEDDIINNMNISMSQNLLDILCPPSKAPSKHSDSGSDDDTGVKYDKWIAPLKPGLTNSSPLI